MTEPILSEEDLMALIAAWPWRPALWAEGTDARHEYVMQFWVADSDFISFSQHIRQHGYRAKWGRYSLVYFEAGNWTYWVLDKPPCINREHRSVPTLRKPASRAEAEQAPAQLRLD